MKTSKIKLLTLGSILSLMTILSCSGNDSLDQVPIDPNSTTSNQVYENATTATAALAKLYAGLAITGQKGPAGSNDLDGIIDEGTSSYLRLLTVAQDATTDVMKLAWPGDSGGSLDVFQVNQWDNQNLISKGLYYRIYVEIAYCNDFLRNSEKIASDSEVAKMRAEARFLRALMYYNVVDLFGKGPYVIDTDPVVGYKPPQYSRQQLFDFIEAELKAIDGSVASVGSQSSTGRIDQGAVWTLLSRLYLNASVYTGTDRYADAATYAKKVIDGGYDLSTTTSTNGKYKGYQRLFMTDNRTDATVSKEIIFCVNSDGSKTQSYGGATFLTNASLGGSMDAANWGGSKWEGSRVTKQFVNLFQSTATNSNGDPIAWADDRAFFYITGQSLSMSNWKTFTNGYAYPKFFNKSSTDVVGVSTSFSDLDLPIMRLGEVILTYAEAKLRTGNTAEALTYINKIRTRSHVNELTSVSLSDVINERGRELAWEGFRRSDLIRFGQYTGGSYNWEWKGNLAAGQSIADKYKVFPIPQTDLDANHNLTPTDGY